MTPRFKDERLQAMYEKIVTMARAKTRMGGVTGEAYRKGAQGLPSQWLRDSLAHAAWQAGADSRKPE